MDNKESTSKKHFFFLREGLYVALTGLKLIRSACLCLLTAGIKGHVTMPGSGKKQP